MKRLALALALVAGGSLAVAQAPVERHLDDPEAHANSAERTALPENEDANEPETLDEALSEDVALSSEVDTDEGYVLGESALRLDMPASPLSLEPATEEVVEPDPHADLELALRLPTYDFDGVSFISASRSLITGVLETYCATGMLLPDEDGLETVDVILGAGCLLGATTLYIMGIRKLLHPSEERRAVERLARFEALRSGAGLSDEDVALFENELHGAARRDRRRRIIEIIFGGLNIVATATLAGLTARGRIHSTTGTSIATGTAALGVLSLSSIFVRSPSERAWSNYQAR